MLTGALVLVLFLFERWQLPFHFTVNPDLDRGVFIECKTRFKNLSNHERIVDINHVSSPSYSPFFYSFLCDVV